MKNHELLNLIGDVNEDYVLEAGSNIVKPRFRWKTLAACAACAALVLAAYPVYRMAQGQSGAGLLPLHDYTVVEGGGTLDTQNELKSPASGGGVFSGENVGGPSKGGDGTLSGNGYSAPGQDAPVQEEAAAQYQGLLQGLGGQEGREPETYPDWFAGAWIDNDYQPEAKLAVAIVDGFRTNELEAQILSWCGGTGEVVFHDAKYSLAYLYSIQDPAVEAVANSDGVNSCGVGVNVTENTLDVDVYGESISKEALVKLGQLDPKGDAIRVRLFTGSISTQTDEIKKGPAPVPGGKTEPVFDGARVEPSVEDAPAPVDGSERAMPAAIPGEIGELPEKKYDGYDAVRDADGQAPAKYDIIEGE